MAHPSFLEQAGPDPRPLHSTGTTVDQPGESVTSSVTSGVLQTVESQIAVLPALMTTSRSLVLSLKVHGFFDVELMVRSMSTGPRVFWPSGTDGVMRTDSGSHTFEPAASATVVVPSVGAGAGVGDDRGRGDRRRDGPLVVAGPRPELQTEPGDEDQDGQQQQTTAPVDLGGQATLLTHVSNANRRDPRAKIDAP